MEDLTMHQPERSLSGLWWALTTGLALILMGCHLNNAMPTPGGQLKATVGSTAMQTQALAKTSADVATYQVTLYTAANVAVGPAVTVQPNATATFTGVADGTGYYVKADAFDATNTAISLAGPVQSTNTASVSAGEAAYSAGTQFTVTVPLKNGTAGTATTTGLLTPNTQVSPGTGYFALVNNSSLRAITKAGVFMQGGPFAYTWSNLQDGAKSATTGTHEMWAATLSNGAAPERLTIAKPLPFPAAANGLPPATFNATLPNDQIDTPNTTEAVRADLGIALDSANDLYFYNGTDFKVARQATSYPIATATVLIAAPNPAPIAMAVNGAGDLFYATTTAIVRARKADNYARTTVLSGLTITDSGFPGTMPRKLAVDEKDTLYWYDDTATKLKRSRLIGSAYETPVDTGVGLASTTMLAVDAYGDMFYATGADSLVRKATLGVDKVTYGAPVTVADFGATGDNVGSLAVDRAGDVYVTGRNRNPPRIYLKPASTASTGFWPVAGDGTATGADAITNAQPMNVSLKDAEQITVNRNGRVAFLSKAADDTTFRLRILR